MKEDKGEKQRYHREYYLKNKEKANKKSREYYYADKSRDRNRVLLRKFGITLDEYKKMFTDQNGECATCKRHQSEFKRVFAVDHNHVTGKVRSLLCHRCNTAIGLVYEDPKTLSNMIQYLKNQ